MKLFFLLLVSGLIISCERKEKGFCSQDKSTKVERVRYVFDSLSKLEKKPAWIDECSKLINALDANSIKNITFKDLTSLINFDYRENGNSSCQAELYNYSSISLPILFSTHINKFVPILTFNSKGNIVKIQFIIGYSNGDKLIESDQLNSSTFFNQSKVDSIKALKPQRVKEYDKKRKKLLLESSSKNQRKKSDNQNNNELVKYKIINQEKLSDIKFSMDIRLTQKTTKHQLRKIALDIKSRLKKNYDRIFIVYYLPEMQIENGGWASSHFDPTLDVQIMGLTIEEESKLLTEASKVIVDKIVGRWVGDGSVMTMFRKGSTTFLKTNYYDHTVQISKLDERIVNGQKRYIEEDGHDFGEFFIIEGNGNLNVYDNHGLIFTAIKK